MEAVSYLIFQVRGDSPDVMQRHLAQAFEIIMDNDCLIENIMSSIAVATFRTKVATYEQLLEALHTRLGPNIRVVHGRGEYPRGIFGSQRRLSYGTIFPDITSKLETLFAMEFGTSREI